MSIKIQDILSLENERDYKVHLANWNGKNRPLDIFVTDKERWKGWNSYRGEKDAFNRQYIFSLLEYYHEPDTWLFGGVYEVIKRLNKIKTKGHEIELTSQFKPLIGRLKIKWQRSGRAKARRWL